MLGTVENEECFKITNSGNWNTQLLGCGSNSFGQLNATGMNLMLPIFQSIPVPQNTKANDDEERHIRLISVGANCTILVVNETDMNGENEKSVDNMYMWGTAKGIQTISSIPLKCSVRQISCGQSHIGLVSSQGKVYTWGSNEFGYLGHENKTALTAPKVIKSMCNLFAVSISCGAFHTGIIARESSTNDIDSDTSDSLPFNTNDCGHLYMCGQGKTGQVGIEKLPNSGLLAKPTKLTFFENVNQLVYKVSCGFHHTLVVSVIASAPSAERTSKVYAFGYNEHGRLGNGNEHKSLVPVEVKFPSEFTAVDVSAGEQHSLAAGVMGGYAWGSNSMGQLGSISPSVLPFSMTPLSIPRLDTVRIAKLVAGGRHSACLTTCGKLYTWGWNEEGQLGQNSEKSSYYPRSCPMQRFDKNITVVDIALGMAHTVMLLRNNRYVAPEKQPVEIVKEEVEVAAIPAIVVETITEVETEPEPPATELSVMLTEVFVEPPLARAPPSLVTDADMDDLPSPYRPAVTEDVMTILSPKPPQPQPSPTLPVIVQKQEVIQGIKELLQQREARKAKEPPLVLPDIALTSSSSSNTVAISPPRTQQHISPESTIVIPIESIPTVVTAIEKNNTAVSKQSSNSTKNPAGYQVFYKDGQNLSTCLVANSAKRAQIRKERSTVGKMN